MPTESRVKIEALGDGHSGAETFRLSVTDERGIIEIPRVLKVGEAGKVHDEVRRYYRYVHNKKIGGASRVDVVQGFWWPREADRVHEPKRYGAVVYTLVGAGDRVEAWSKWALTASSEDLSAGFEMLRDQLSCWHDRTRGTDGRTVAGFMIDPLTRGLKNYLDADLAINPTFEQVRRTLTKLANFNWDGFLMPAKTCVVHGDLHTDNLFALLTPRRRL